MTYAITVHMECLHVNYFSQSFFFFPLDMDVKMFKDSILNDAVKI